MIRLVIVDDHALIRRGMRDVLSGQKDMEIAGEAGNAAELRALLAATPCDVLLLDINLPGESGLDILQELARSASAPRALVVSMYPEDQYAVRSLRAGAWGYVNKSADSHVLVGAIRTVAQGQKFISQATASLLVERLAQPAPSLPHERLSDIERQMLILFGTTQQLAQIAGQLGLSPKSASVYRARLLEKMKFSGNAELAHYALRHDLA